MKKNVSKKSAFTLIELLIVITIIGILSGILIMDFNGVKDRQAVAMQADKSLAMLQDAKAEVKSGKLVETDGVGEEMLAAAKAAVCEGAVFSIGESPSFVTAPYDEIDGKCSMDKLSKTDYGVSSGKSAVFGIDMDGTSISKIYAIFSPPNGQMKLFDENLNEKIGDASILFAANADSDFQVGLDLIYLSSDAILHEE